MRHKMPIYSDYVETLEQLIWSQKNRSILMPETPIICYPFLYGIIINWYHKSVHFYIIIGISRILSMIYGQF